jgi:hypothetical protein
MSISRVPGTSGIQESIVDAKGDIIAASGADAVVRVAVGTDGQVLTASSAAAGGVTWGTVDVSAAADVILVLMNVI